ncbi:hypothetical protein [Paracraurococcus lichenis]|uniref:Uncharacterized protein n=1 Tax=Paracraurococcus lichenis TaxID=3064888 RepID=A0ABT9EA12_9PROT|nr:hypothetical protein [Paracraurococcus sp. LOR1-02]MDO9713042.1 hypothetical protein [Paracraurococcus sp. LOR1-02]
MAADWEQMMGGEFQAHAAQAGCCRLSVIGGGNAWHWFVRCDRHGDVEGRGGALDAAKVTAEDVARGLARDAGTA